MSEEKQKKRSKRDEKWWIISKLKKEKAGKNTWWLTEPWEEVESYPSCSRCSAFLATSPKSPSCACIPASSWEYKGEQQQGRTRKRNKSSWFSNSGADVEYLKKRTWKKKKNPRQQPAIDRQTTIDTDLEIECRVDIHSVDIGARGSHASTDIRPRRWKGRLVDGPCVSPIGIFPPVRRCAIRAGFIALPNLSLAIEFGRWKRRFVDGAIFARVPVNPIGHEADHGESG